MDSLRIYLITWNVAAKAPEGCLTDLVGFGGAEEKLPDVYVVGLQEVNSQIHNMVIDALFDDPWTGAFKSLLKTKNYVKLKTIRMRGLVLSVYTRRKHLLSIRDVEVQYTKTGLGRMWGNKGLVAVRFNVYGVSVCLVNTHLTPHDQHLQSRIEDYNHILKETHFVHQKQTTLILYHDYVFWIGDQNFRIDEAIDHKEILSKIEGNQLEWLRSADQLKTVMKSGQAFSELVEEPFTFPPTYKFLFNSSEYDPKRRPAWTDRILYKVNENAYENITLSAKMELYKSFPEYSVSDHKPVAGEFVFKVFSDYSERLVEFEPIKSWYINEENDVGFVPGDDVAVSDWDWIGVYKADFSSLDEYVSFVYINPVKPLSEERSRPPSPAQESSPSGSRRKEIRFPDSMVRGPGRYCLLYMTADSGSVLGISSVFEAVYKQGTGSSNLSTSSTSEKREKSPSRRSPRRSPVRYN